MNKETINNELEHKASIAFKQQTQSLDSDTLYRLRLARKTALSHTEQSSLPSFNLKWLTGAGAGLALAGILTFMIAPSLMSSSNEFLPLDELELMTTEGEIESEMDLITQLDFYQWIDESSLSK